MYVHREDATTLQVERPVFFAEGGRRARAVRAGVLLFAALATAWLAALIAGALGFGALPRLPVARVGFVLGRTHTAPGRTDAALRRLHSAPGRPHTSRSPARTPTAAQLDADSKPTSPSVKSRPRTADPSHVRRPQPQPASASQQDPAPVVRGHGAAVGQRTGRAAGLNRRTPTTSMPPPLGRRRHPTTGPVAQPPVSPVRNIPAESPGTHGRGR